ncbi:hypothetical protein [Sinosporangium album]|nr:hypothetical protein [Sinosporangium album]
MDALRRTLVMGVAGVSAAAALPIRELEQLRGIVDAALGTSPLDDWHERVWEYAARFATDPMQDLVRDLGTDILAVHDQMQSAPADRVSGWLAVNAHLTEFMARAMGSAGHIHEARGWWATARQAAHSSGDPDIIAKILGNDGMHCLYHKRTQVAISRATTAFDHCQGRPTRNAAYACSVLAQAHAVLGNATAAHTWLRTQAEIFEQLPDQVTSERVTVGGFPEAAILHTRSYVFTHLRQEDEGRHAQERALAAYDPDDTRQIAMVELHRALLSVRLGDVAEGVERAQRIAREIAPGKLTTFVASVATDVVRNIPAKHQARDGVLELKELLALPRGASSLSV